MQLGDRARHDFNILLKHDLLHRPLNVVIERSMPKQRCWRYLRGICRKMTWAVKKPWFFGSRSVLHYQWESLLTNQVMEWNLFFWTQPTLYHLWSLFPVPLKKAKRGNQHVLIFFGGYPCPADIKTVLHILCQTWFDCRQIAKLTKQFVHA